MERVALIERTRHFAGESIRTRIAGGNRVVTRQAGRASGRETIGRRIARPSGSIIR